MLTLSTAHAPHLSAGKKCCLSCSTSRFHFYISFFIHEICVSVCISSLRYEKSIPWTCLFLKKIKKAAWFWCNSHRLGSFPYALGKTIICPVAVRVFSFFERPRFSTTGAFWKVLVEYFSRHSLHSRRKKEEETSKVLHVTEITIPGTVSNIEITLKFHVALL